MKRRLANGHLTGDEISALMAGLDAPGSREHAQGCSVCGAELAALQSAVLSVRESGRAWATDVAVQPARIELSEAAWFEAYLPTFGQARFALAGVLLAGVLLVPGWHREAAPQPVQTAQLEISDSALLAQVDLQVSRAVPETMELLANPDSWNSVPSDSAYAGGDAQTDMAR
jgi:hypothetical protein